MGGNGMPRIAPGSRRDIGVINSAAGYATSRYVGARRTLNIFPTLARHRRLFRAWLRFAGQVGPKGTLPQIDTELVILRVARNCHCEYEWVQHRRLAVRAGLPEDLVDKVKDEPASSVGFSRHQLTLLRAVDELHAQRRISDETWSELCGEYSEKQLIELCLLTGHYEMLAMTLNSLGVVPDPP